MHPFLHHVMAIFTVYLKISLVEHLVLLYKYMSTKNPKKSSGLNMHTMCWGTCAGRVKVMGAHWHIKHEGCGCIGVPVPP